MSTSTSSFEKNVQALADQYSKKQAAAKTAAENAAKISKAKNKVQTDQNNVDDTLKGITGTSKTLATYQEAAVAAYATYGPSSPQYAAALGAERSVQRTLDTLNNQLKKEQATLATDKAALAKLTAPTPPPNTKGSHSSKPGVNSKSTQLNSTSTTNKYAQPVIYNAPLLSSKYYRGIQSDILNGNYIFAGNYTDALHAWSIDPKTGTSFGSRGAIQVDRKTNTAAAIADAQKKKLGTNFKIDNNTYGFKFLYNPQSVNMSWNAVQATDPVYEAAGTDPFVPGTSNLVSSFISFSLILNRIEDLPYLDSNGIKGSKSPYPHFYVNPATTLDEEAKQIYEKGTMYDLEYLFKTMHANGAYTGYQSTLMNSTTSDPGWLPVRPVELHLGNKLRYRVRIASLSVDHTIFDARMVPLLTTVNITCARYWDGAAGTITLGS